MVAILEQIPSKIHEPRWSVTAAPTWAGTPPCWHPYQHQFATDSRHWALVFGRY